MFINQPKVICFEAVLHAAHNTGNNVNHSNIGLLSFAGAWFMAHNVIKLGQILAWYDEVKLVLANTSLFGDISKILPVTCKAVYVTMNDFKQSILSYVTSHRINALPNTSAEYW